MRLRHPSMSETMMIISFFKKNKTTPEQAEALDQANIALRIRMDRLLHVEASKNTRLPDKTRRQSFEGQMGAAH